MALCKELFGTKFSIMVLELNASDDRGINVVRDQVKAFASTRQIGMVMSIPKIIILDEADSMTGPAQMALRRIMEKYTKNVRFILICNMVAKLLPAITSRCTRFRFKAVDPNLSKERVQEICINENMTMSTDALDALIEISEGDMRKTINTLQAA